MKNKNLALSALATLVLSLAFACGSPNNSEPTTTGSDTSTDSAPSATAAPDNTPTQTYVTHRGAKPWHHWDHAPQFARPNFTWENDDSVARVTCTAVDSHGQTYAVTEDGYRGKQYQGVMIQVEDSSVDRCYANSHGDAGCRYQDCEPGYRGKT